MPSQNRPAADAVTPNTVTARRSHMLQPLQSWRKSRRALCKFEVCFAVAVVIGFGPLGQDRQDRPKHLPRTIRNYA